MSLMTSIKNFLKRFLPPPVRFFNREIARVLAAIAKQEREIAQIKSTMQALPEQRILFNDHWERRFIRTNWGDVTQDPDFAEKFIRLTANMDPQSIETVIRIIIRNKQILESDKIKLDLFTRAEQDKLRLLKEEFTSEILKLSDNLYAYRNYLLPKNHFEASVFYYKHGIAELKTADTVKGKAIIDAGGYIGDSVLVLNELEPSAIYAFEAVPGNYELLKQTVELNHIPNVIAENLALGAESGTMTMHVFDSASTSVALDIYNYTDEVTVPATTLDAYVKAHGLNIGLIKIDIEGGEPAFLAGAKQTICEQKPILLLSIYHNAHDFFELKPLIESWNLGYKFRLYKPVFGTVALELMLLAEAEKTLPSSP